MAFACITQQQQANWVFKTFPATTHTTNNMALISPFCIPTFLPTQTTFFYKNFTWTSSIFVFFFFLLLRHGWLWVWDGQEWTLDNVSSLPPSLYSEKIFLAFYARRFLRIWHFYVYCVSFSRFAAIKRTRAFCGCAPVLRCVFAYAWILPFAFFALRCRMPHTQK